jgi:putative transcriptional regulator
MTIQHHPLDELLTAFAAGTLDLGQHVAVATHLTRCSHCRDVMNLMEHVGGAVLAGLSPTPMSSDAFARIETRLREPVAHEPRSERPERKALDDIPGLPAFVRQYSAAPWKWIAPGVRLRPIQLPAESDTRVFLLKSSPGTKMLEHTHTGTEMTCVLTGSFSHEAGHYGPGDFDLGDESVNHNVIVGPGEDCICLVAMHGELRLAGIIGTLIQPFIRL